MASVEGDIGTFIPSTYLFDTERINSIKMNSPEFREFLVRVHDSINNMANVVNLKDTGIYDLVEYVNGQVFFPDQTLNSQTAGAPIERQVFRLVINFGALPNAGTKNVAHGLTIGDTWTFTRIYATSSDTTGKSYLPIPYASSTANQNIELSVDATNVSITTGIDRTAYTVTYVILEYIKY